MKQALYEGYVNQLKSISEKRQWLPYLRRADGKGELSGWQRYVTACMLENANNYLSGLTEDIKTLQVGTFAKFTLPIVRSVFPNLVAMNLVSVQPMTAPVGLVFYLDYIYGKTKGKITAGEISFGARVGHTSADTTYSAERVEGEVPSGFIGDGAKKEFKDKNLSYVPIRPGSVLGETLVGGTTIQFQDDGNGNFVGVGLDTTKANTIDYVTGAIVLNFTTAPETEATISFTYDYDSEGNADTPTLELMLSSSPVTSRARKLRTRWSVEAQQDLANVHGLDAEAEMVSAIAEQIKFEIDREIINDLYNIADKTSISVFDLTPPVGSEYLTHKMTIIDKFVEAGGVILRKTKRLTGNWIIAGERVANVIESLPAPALTGGAPVGNGVVYLGKLNNRWDVYRDPHFPQDKYMVGALGSSIVDAGYVYLPYIPLYTTATFELDDMILRKGLMSRYAKKIINKNFYIVGSVIKS